MKDYTSLPRRTQLFISYYIETLHATQSAISAGYSPKTAYSSGSRLLKHPDVAPIVERLLSDKRAAEIETIPHGRVTRKTKATSVKMRLSDKRTPKRACVYLIREEHGAVKVGNTVNLVRRMQDLSTGCPYELDLLATFEHEDVRFVEAFIHRVFADKHIRGEWYHLSDADVRMIVSVWEN